MKIITDYEELVGKTIAFAHMAQFAEKITIATTDGSVIVAKQDLDEEFGERIETRILYPGSATRYIEENEYIREELARLGIFDLETYKNKLAEEERKRREENKANRLKKEKEEYKRLRAKYGDQ